MSDITTPGKPTRRQVLKQAGIAGLMSMPLARPALAQVKMRDITMRLDWLFQGPNAASWWRRTEASTVRSG